METLGTMQDKQDEELLCLHFPGGYNTTLEEDDQPTTEVKTSSAMAHMLSAGEHMTKFLRTLHHISHQARDLEAITRQGLHEGEPSYSRPGRLMAELHHSSIQLANDFGAWKKLYPGLHQVSSHLHPTVAPPVNTGPHVPQPQQTNLRCLHIQLSNIFRAAEAMTRQVDKFMQEPTRFNFNGLVTLEATLVHAIETVFLDWGACLEVQSDHDRAAAVGYAAAAAPLHHQTNGVAANVGPNMTEVPTEVCLEDHLRAVEVDTEDLYQEQELL